MLGQKLEVKEVVIENRIEQVWFENYRVRSEDGRGMQGEWTKAKGGRSKKLVSPNGIDVKK